MASKTWIGNDGDSIYDARGWSPFGSPQPADTLYLISGTADMRGGNLSSATLLVGTTVSESAPAPAVVNLSGDAVLTAYVDVADFNSQDVTFNATGVNSLYLEDYSGYYAEANIAENIAAHSTLKGNFQAGVHNPEITINGADDTAKFQNVGDSFLTEGTATINADVIGTGSFTASLYSVISFLGAVGTGQTINSEGADLIQIDKPLAFHGLVNFLSETSNSVELDGLTQVDSFHYEDNLLSFFDAGHLVDTLRFAAGQNNFQVTADAGGVKIDSFFYDQTSPPPPGTTILPQHA